MIEKSRRSIRLKDFDYSQSGAYFVTIVTHQRRCFFGEVAGGDVQLSEAGRIVNEMWQRLSERFDNVSADSFVVMPNHVHGIVTVGAQLIAPDGAGDGAMNRAPTLGQIIRAVKAASTYRIRQSTGLEALWQRNYYEHVIRDGKSLDRIRRYIAENPARWQFDPNNPNASSPDPEDAWRL